MREHLQMSKPSMSRRQEITNSDIVKQQFTRGSRKQHFIAEKTSSIFPKFLYTKVEREVDTNLEAVERHITVRRNIKNLDLDDHAKAKSIKSKLN